MTLQTRRGEIDFGCTAACARFLLSGRASEHIGQAKEPKYELEKWNSGKEKSGCDFGTLGNLYRRNYFFIEYKPRPQS